MPELTEGIMRRFFRKVYRSDLTECWIWTGARNLQGYGRLVLPGFKAAFLAHRISYVKRFGEPRDGSVVMHLCDNPSCVNPEHLKAGTCKRNTWDMIKKGRQSGGVKVLTACPF